DFNAEKCGQRRRWIQANDLRGAILNKESEVSRPTLRIGLKCRSLWRDVNASDYPARQDERHGQFGRVGRDHTNPVTKRAWLPVRPDCSPQFSRLAHSAATF